MSASTFLSAKHNAFEIYTAPYKGDGRMVTMQAAAPLGAQERGLSSPPNITSSLKPLKTAVCVPLAVSRVDN